MDQNLSKKIFYSKLNDNKAFKEYLYYYLFNNNINRDKTLLLKLKALVEDIYTKTGFEEYRILAQIIKNAHLNNVYTAEVTKELLLDDSIPDYIKDNIFKYADIEYSQEYYINALVRLDDILQVKTIIESVAPNLNKFLHKLLDGSYVSFSEIISNLKSVGEDVIQSLVKFDSSDVIDIFDIEAAEEKLIEHIKSEKKKIKIKSFGILDDYGLLETRRLILFGAPTNQGKTTMLSSIIAYSLKNLDDELLYYYLSGFENIDLDKYSIGFVFLTLEEIEHEIKNRLFSNLFDITTSEIKNLTSDKIRYMISDLDLHPKAKLIVKWMPPLSTTTADINIFLERLKIEHNILPVVVVVDYLDKISLPYKTKNEYRIQLQHVSVELRRIAIEHNLCLITATQLNKAALNKKQSLDYDKLAEAFSKSWEADVVFLFRMLRDEKPLNSPTAVFEGSLVKSRVSPTFLKPVYLKADLSKSKFLETYSYNKAQLL